MPYDIVDVLLDAKASSCVIKLAEIGKYIVLPRDHLGAIHRDLPPKTGKRRYDITIFPDSAHKAVIEGRHFDWPQFCYEELLLPYPTAAVSQIPEEMPSDSRSYIEGAIVRIEVNKYERDPAARAECLRHHGAVCTACGCDMSLAYGDDLRNFIHVHHTVPISSLGTEYSINPKTDLIPLCPNCHAVVHKFAPPLNIEQLKQRLSKGGTIVRGRDGR